MLRQICSGVAHLHEHKVAHRDLKPSNVLMQGSQSGLSILKTSFTNFKNDFLSNEFRNKCVSLSHSPFLSLVFFLSFVSLVFLSNENNLNVCLHHRFHHPKRKSTGSRETLNVFFRFQVVRSFDVYSIDRKSTV